MQLQSYTFRRGRRGDVRDVADLAFQVGTEKGLDPSLERLITSVGAVLDDKGGFFMVAKSVAGFAGVAAAQVIQSFDRDELVAICSLLLVHRDHRGRGVGGTLISALENWAAKRAVAVVIPAMYPWPEAERIALDRSYKPYEIWLKKGV